MAVNNVITPWKDLAVATPNPALRTQYAEPTAEPTYDPQTVVEIGGEQLTLAQVDNLVKAGKDVVRLRAEADALIERNETARELAELTDILSPDNQLLMTQLLRHVLEAQQSGRTVTSIQEVLQGVSPKFDAPADYVRVKTSDMDPMSATVAEQVHSVRYWAEEKFRAIDALVQNLGQHVGAVLQQAQQVTVAQVASQQLGFDVTPAHIAEWAKAGITDPLAAIKAGILRPAAGGGGGTAGAEAQPVRKPIAAPSGNGQAKVIPPDAEPSKVRELSAQGWKFEDPALEEIRLARFG